MQSKKVSIVITCYNDHQYIEQAVTSAIGQNWINKEIILVDDGSSESTKQVLRKIQPKIDLLITQENKGVSAARNVGIGAATGDYILILDSDDYYREDFCNKAVKKIENDPEIKIVTSFAKWFTTDRVYSIFRPEGGGIKNFLLKNAVLAVLFRRSDFIRTGGYDECMLTGYEDWELYIRILRNGGRAEVLPEILFFYRNKMESRNKKANLEKYELLEYIYLKHSDLYKEHFDFFVKEWLFTTKKSEAFKQQVMNSLDYKVGSKILRPFRLLGLFRKGKDL